MKKIVGLDIGGTKIAAGFVRPDGTVISKITRPTFAEKGFSFSIERVFRTVEELIAESGEPGEDIAGIGVCAPGPLDPENGIVYNPPNLPGWKNVPLVEMLQKRFKVEVRMDNDANAAGIAELLWGAAEGCRDVFYVTVSTGIGTAVIIGGRIYHGKNGMAGEAGHVTINSDSEKKCNCGTPGCIESIASGTSVARDFKEMLRRKKITDSPVVSLAGGLESITMEHIAAAAENGDTLALETIQAQGKNIGIWLGGMISVLDPEMIVIGGGVSLVGDMLFQPIRETIPKNTINPFASETPVVQAKLRKDVGICGAASLLSADRTERA